jgi:hypothetical protein
MTPNGSVDVRSIEDHRLDTGKPVSVVTSRSVLAA